MSKILIAVSFVMMGLASLAGCALEAEDELIDETEEAAGSEAGAPGQPELVEVPEELSYDRLPGARAEVRAGGCYVRLEYCRDPRHGRRSTYCSRGCSFVEAPVKAAQLCVDRCGDACNRLKDLGRC